MVFVIQHTQACHQRATQRKLDEILQAMPGRRAHKMGLPPVTAMRAPEM
jgi:low affinity Fe/Cu permease